MRREIHVKNVTLKLKPQAAGGADLMTHIFIFSRMN